MTGKQFTLETRDCFNWGIHVVDIIKDNGIELPQSTVCDLLNKLTEEKQLLQEINEKQAQYNQRIDKVLGEGGVILTKYQLKSLIEMKNDDEHLRMISELKKKTIRINISEENAESSFKNLTTSIQIDTAIPHTIRRQI